MMFSSCSGPRAIVILLVLSFLAVTHAISCKGLDGQDVDWFVIYKLPRLTNSHSNHLVQAGSSFFYFDDSSSSFAAPPVGINDDKSPVMLTVNQLKSTSVSYAMYNDESDYDAASASFAHAKGTIGFNSKEGFWLIHSVPSFPLSSSFGYPQDGLRYAQTFMCISMSLANVNKVLDLVRVNRPNTYDFRAPATTAAAASVPSFPAFVQRLVDRSRDRVEGSIVSAKGTSFSVFAKSAQASINLWEELVQPSLKVPSFVTGTWGRPLMPSSCVSEFPRNTMNAEEFLFPDGTAFSTGSDHSKWGMAYHDSKPWVCIGDINRMTSQTKRGGGAACLLHPNLHSSFASVVSKIALCPSISEGSNGVSSFNSTSTSDSFRVSSPSSSSFRISTPPTPPVVTSDESPSFLAPSSSTPSSASSDKIFNWI